ncbi:MAG: hypothetical protein GY754_04765 [bacterium]|nr:hypothetical protein [bacterium]
MKHRKKIYFVLLLFLVSSLLYAESKDIVTIRKQFNQITKNLGKYKVTKKEETLQEEVGPPYGRVVSRYTHKKKVYCIKAEIILDLAGNVMEYYYWNNKLFFVYEYSWNGDKRQHVSAENRYYFKNNTMIRWLAPGGKKISPKTKAYIKKSKEVLRSSKAIFKEM